MYGKGKSVFLVEPIITSSRKPSYREFNNPQKLRIQSEVGGLPRVHTLTFLWRKNPHIFLLLSEIRLLSLTQLDKGAIVRGHKLLNIFIHGNGILIYQHNRL